MIEYAEFISRKYVKENPNKIFLFGDNLQHIGLGGQAKEMRDEPNAIGIPTKKTPSMSNDSFFTDNEFEQNIHAIDDSLKEIFEKSKNNSMVIVIPKYGIGTGFAELPKRAPRTYHYLLMRLKELERL